MALNRFVNGVSLNASKDKGKGKKASGEKVKHKRKVYWSEILTMDIVG
jgi:hypothetical protein